MVKDNSDFNEGFFRKLHKVEDISDRLADLILCKKIFEFCKSSKKEVPEIVRCLMLYISEFSIKSKKPSVYFESMLEDAYNLYRCFDKIFY